MEKLLLLYLHDKRTASIVFLSIFLLEGVIGFAFYKNSAYASSFTHLMYVAVTLSAFFFPIWAAIGQGITAGAILGFVYFTTNGSRNGDIKEFLIITIGYFISAALIIGLLKNKIINFYLRKEEIFYIDEFTGLPNMSALFRDIQQYKEQNSIQSMKFLLVEITNQKEISAAFGMQMYYRLQKEMAHQAKNFFQSDLKVYQIRLGTVAVLFPPNEKVDLYAMKKKPTQTIVVGNIPIFFDVMCSGCEFPRDGTTTDELLQKGFLALQEAHKRGQIYFEYTPALQAPQKVWLLGQMQSAMEKQEILFHYQPILDAQGLVKDVEALVRWDHPQLGLLPPSDFIPDLELTEISDTLVEYALDYNLHNLKQLSMQGFDLHIAINVTIKNLQQRYFSRRVLATLAEYQLQPSSLVLEITERGFLSDAEESNRNISELSRWGVSFHIDDFGVGFTSLGNLRKFGIRSIKIDQSFIANMQKDKINRALVDSVIAMAKAIGISTVAEGVESEEMLEALRDMGVDYFQGYAIARPMPFEELCGWLQNHQETWKRIEKKE
jgi:EAL domain-containing protein (putative c-di-GMP-specific phosphodiesterase class I)/GGDEF domain-containing protein